MNIDIENIDNIGNRHKNYTKQWRKSTKLYNKSYLMNMTFSSEFFKNCKNNVNENHNLTIDVRNNIKRMATEQGLYAQVVMLH